MSGIGGFPQRPTVSIRLQFHAIHPPQPPPTTHPQQQVTITIVVVLVLININKFLWPRGERGEKDGRSCWSWKAREEGTIFHRFIVPAATPRPSTFVRSCRLMVINTNQLWKNLSHGERWHCWVLLGFRGPPTTTTGRATPWIEKDDCLCCCTTPSYRHLLLLLHQPGIFLVMMGKGDSTQEEQEKTFPGGGKIQFSA